MCGGGAHVVCGREDKEIKAREKEGKPPPLQRGLGAQKEGKPSESEGKRPSRARGNFLSEWYRCGADKKKPPMGSTYVRPIGGVD